MVLSRTDHVTSSECKIWHKKGHLPLQIYRQIGSTETIVALTNEKRPAAAAGQINDPSITVLDRALYNSEWSHLTSRREATKIVVN